jgi:hypothetical protein
VSAAQKHVEFRLPAYGRQLLDLRRCGMVPEREIVIALDCWKWGEGWPRMVVPHDIDAAAADFLPVAGIPCFLAWGSSKTTLARRDQIIKAIVRCRPSFLWLVDMEMPEQSFIVVSHARGLELEEYR